jgi:hypothetical protein
MGRAAHAARKQVLARAQPCLCDPGFRRVASLLDEFKPYRLLGFALHHSCTGNNAPILGDVAHPKPDEVATSQLAVDGEIEKGSIPSALG